MSIFLTGPSRFIPGKAIIFSSGGSSTPTPAPTAAPEQRTVLNSAMEITLPTGDLAVLGNGNNVIDNVAWYKFTLNNTDVVNLNTISSPGYVDTQIILFNSLGEFVATNDDGGGRGTSIIMRSLDPDTYYLAVSYYALSVVNGTDFDAVYDLGNGALGDNIVLNAKIEVIEPDPTEAPVESPVPLATPITLPTSNLTVSSSGTNILRNIAWYTFTITETTYLQIDTIGSNNGSNLDTYICLYNSSGVLVGVDDDTGTNGWSNLVLTSVDPDTYYIGVGYAPMTTLQTQFNSICLTGITDSNIILNARAILIPVANFTSDVTDGFLPLTVQFTDTSTNTPTSWRWNFGDGTPVSTLQNPTHTYTTAGSFTVSIVPENSDGNGFLTVPNYIATYVPSYRGTWNPATNTPPVIDGTTTNGTLYQSTGNGTVDLGNGPVTVNTGDYLRYVFGSWYITALNTANLPENTGTTYLGAWDPVENYPFLENGVGDLGTRYRSSGTGTVDFGAGNIEFVEGDYVTYNGTEWEKMPTFAYAPDSTTVNTLPTLKFDSSLTTSGGISDVYTQRAPAAAAFIQTANYNVKTGFDVMNSILTMSLTATPTGDRAGTDTIILEGLMEASVKNILDSIGGDADGTLTPTIRANLESLFVRSDPENPSSTIDVKKTFQHWCKIVPDFLKEMYDSAGVIIEGILASINEFPENGYHLQEQWPTMSMFLTRDDLPTIAATLQSWRTAMAEYVDVEAGPPSADISVTSHTLIIDPINKTKSIIVQDGDTVVFEDKSTHKPDEWHWSFGDGSAENNDQNPSHTYTYTANNGYDQNFLVEMWCSNFVDRSIPSDTLLVRIRVPAADPIEASFTVTPDSGTYPLGITVTDTSVPAATYRHWNFGESAGSGPDVYHNTYSAAGIYTVTLTVGNVDAIESTATKTIAVGGFNLYLISEGIHVVYSTQAAVDLSSTNYHKVPDSALLSLLNQVPGTIVPGHILDGTTFGPLLPEYISDVLAGRPVDWAWADGTASSSVYISASTIYP